MLIVIDEYGVAIDRDNGRFSFQNGKAQRRIHPSRVSAIHLRKTGRLSSAAVLLAEEHDIPILIFNSKGQPQARIWSARPRKNAQIRLAQLTWTGSAASRNWIRGQLQRKLSGQAEVLNELGEANAASEIHDLATRMTVSSNLNWLRRLEARAGQIYWPAWFTVLGQPPKHRKRSRRPAKDPLNALLNYGYGMLYGAVETAVLTAGLDPQLGILHRMNHGQAAFVFDAIEPYRPWVDALAAKLTQQERDWRSWFREEEGRFWFLKMGKRTFIEAWEKYFEEKVDWEGRRMRRKTHVQTNLSVLAQELLHPMKGGPGAQDGHV